MAEATESTPEATELEEATEPAAPEATEEEQPQAPDVGESLQQMNQRLTELGERLPAQEEAPDLLASLSAPLEDPDYEAGEEQPFSGEEQGEGEDDENQLRQLLGEEINRAVTPLYIQQATQQRTAAIQAYAEKHQTEFGDPKVVDEMAAMLEEAGMQPTDGTPPRADHVELVHKAYITDAAASEDKTPAEAASGEGATLETGAGPGVPEAEVDPVEQRWADALKPNENKSAFD